jgi:t-SNARE complex subunit (syntaxin)
LDTVASLTNEVEGLHKTALLLADAKDLAQISAKIEIKVTAAALNIESARKNLKGMEESFHTFRSLKPMEFQALQSKHQSLCSQFLKFVGAFEDMQARYRNKYKQQLQRQYLLVNPQASQQELDQLGHSSQTSLLLTQQVFKMDTLKAKKALSEMKERHEEILLIEKSISEIQQMFTDIAMIVRQQGEMINRVDEFLSQTSFDLEAANEELRKRIVVEKKRQIQRVTLYSIGFVVLLVLLLIIGNELRNLFTNK